MCVLLKYLFFDFASEDTLREASNPVRFFAELLAGGEFHLAESAEMTVEHLWPSVVRMRPKNAYLAFENANGLTITFGVYPGEWRRWYAMVYGGVISTPGSEQHIRSLVKTGEMVYKTLHPEYGYGLISLENQLVGAPGTNELDAVYDYNFLSRRLVERLGGNDRVTAVPAWRTEAFDDGGLLVEMAAHPILERKARTANYLKAAQMLGIGRYVQGGA